MNNLCLFGICESNVYWTVHHCNSWRMKDLCYSLQNEHHSTPAAPNLQHTTNWEQDTDVVIQQHSRKLLMMDILISETCWAHRKWNKIASDIKLVFHSSKFCCVWLTHNCIFILDQPELETKLSLPCKIQRLRSGGSWPPFSHCEVRTLSCPFGLAFLPTHRFPEDDITLASKARGPYHCREGRQGVAVRTDSRMSRRGLSIAWM